MLYAELSTPLTDRQNDKKGFETLYLSKPKAFLAFKF